MGILTTTTKNKPFFWWWGGAVFQILIFSSLSLLFMGFSLILSISFARSTMTLFPTQRADSGDNGFDNERPQIATGFLFF